MENDVKKVDEKYIQVSEIRINNALKDYKRAVQNNNLLSLFFSTSISFLIAWASLFNNKEGSLFAWKWIFFSLMIVSAIATIVMFVARVLKNKNGETSLDYVMCQIKNEPYYRTKTRNIDGKAVVFRIALIASYIVVISGIWCILFGCNGWSIEQLQQNEYCGLFLAISVMGTVIWIFGGFFVVNFISQLLFDYDFLDR